MLICLPGLVLPQDIVHFPNDLREVPIAFNPAFIFEKKISRIHVAVSLKPDNQVIQDKGLVESYAFDTLGRMTEYYRTRVKGYGMKEIQHAAVYRKGKRVRRPWVETVYQYSYDTVFVNFYYDSLDRLVVRRLNDGDFYNAWYFKYNNENQIITQLQCRETNTELSRKNFKIGVQNILSTEQFSYEKLTPTQTKRRCLNDEGKSYKEIILNYDSAGRLVDEYSSFVVTWVKQHNTYAYDSLGRLSELVYHEYSGEETIEKSTFEYDTLGHMAMRRNYKNDTLLDEVNFLYKKTEPSVNAIVNRRKKDAMIDIQKFTYEYYIPPKK
ncbi:MAG: hypothetical protein FD123_2447 [Bacteroidetes bacterium]|nr:MAG: hypothetical protein FD123_2447 [Bacteroidota bacterium]